MHIIDKIIKEKKLKEVEIESEEIIKKDKNGNIIYHKNSDGFEYWYEFDSNNNLIHSKNSDGFEYWYEFDSNNNCIHYKDSDGDECWREYDSNNNGIRKLVLRDDDYYLNDNLLKKWE